MLLTTNDTNLWDILRSPFRSWQYHRFLCLCSDPLSIFCRLPTSRAVIGPCKSNSLDNTIRDLLWKAKKITVLTLQTITTLTSCCQVPGSAALTSRHVIGGWRPESWWDEPPPTETQEPWRRGRAGSYNGYAGHYTARCNKLILQEELTRLYWSKKICHTLSTRAIQKQLSVETVFFSRSVRSSIQLSKRASRDSFLWSTRLRKACYTCYIWFFFSISSRIVQNVMTFNKISSW